MRQKRVSPISHFLGHFLLWGLLKLIFLLQVSTEVHGYKGCSGSSWPGERARERGREKEGERGRGRGRGRGKEGGREEDRERKGRKGGRQREGREGGRHRERERERRVRRKSGGEWGRERKERGGERETKTTRKREKDRDTERQTERVLPQYFYRKMFFICFFLGKFPFWKVRANDNITYAFLNLKCFFIRKITFFSHGFFYGSKGDKWTAILPIRYPSNI